MLEKPFQNFMFSYFIPFSFLIIEQRALRLNVSVGYSIEQRTWWNCLLLLFIVFFFFVLVQLFQRDEQSNIIVNFAFLPLSLSHVVDLNCLLIFLNQDLSRRSRRRKVFFFSFRRGRRKFSLATSRWSLIETSTEHIQKVNLITLGPVRCHHVWD